jgi:hypothetical protein
LEKRMILIVSFPDCIQVASGKKHGKAGGKATKDSTIGAAVRQRTEVKADFFGWMERGA